MRVYFIDLNLMALTGRSHNPVYYFSWVDWTFWIPPPVDGDGAVPPSDCSSALDCAEAVARSGPAPLPIESTTAAAAAAAIRRTRERLVRVEVDGVADVVGSAVA